MWGCETCSDQLSRARLVSGTLSSPQSQLSRQIVNKRKKYFLGEGEREAICPRPCAGAREQILCPVPCAPDATSAEPPLPANPAHSSPLPLQKCICLSLNLSGLHENLQVPPPAPNAPYLPGDLHPRLGCSLLVPSLCMAMRGPVCAPLLTVV